MKIQWRKSAVLSLMELDRWRMGIELPPIAPFLRKQINQYFMKQDFSVYVPGREVYLDDYPIGLRMLLISAGTSDPYKVFFQQIEHNVEIYVVRHPRQKPL